MRLAKFYFTISYKKGAHNHHADALSRLLTGTPMDVNGDNDDDIPALLLDIEDNVNYSNIEKTSTLTEEFMEIDYAPVDETLATLEEPSVDVMITPITMEELLSAQLHGRFCSDTLIRLNQGEGFGLQNR